MRISTSQMFDSPTARMTSLTSQADKLHVLDAVNATVAQKCPNNPAACEVELSVYVCDETRSGCTRCRMRW